MKKVLFLMSDTGGGHRAAAEAIRDALFLKYGESAVQVELIDVFKQARFPLNYMPELYPWIVNHSKSSWGLGFNISNTRTRASVLSHSMYFSNATRLKRMVREHPADVVVCVHSVIARPSMHAYQSLEKRPPFITVVTDLVSTHMFWYDKRVERCLVPTQVAYDRGLESGLRPDQLRITGLPVHPRFTREMPPKDIARQELGWDASLPAVLMAAGGEGMGPLYETARAINAKHPRCQLIIIAGKNKPLKDRLEASAWNQPTTIYPFVKDIPRMMAAADILVTKAGPATISEACIAGLPLILSDAIPGQEDGNVDYVVQNNAGVFAPSPDAVADAVTAWLGEGAAGLQHRADSARRLGRPNAVWDIAEEVWNYAQYEPIRNLRRSQARLFP
jgi:1,2-diacylglycerol 3-beta-galactosyltransferase